MQIIIHHCISNSFQLAVLRTLESSTCSNYLHSADQKHSAIHKTNHRLSSSWQGCGLGLETYQRLVSTKIVNVSVSAIDVSCL